MSILKFWISIFGSPNKFLSDNDGVFVNEEYNEMAEKFNITVLTTAVESPWSNGFIHWYISAKNALHNVYGYSANQLVFGHNPNYPTVYSDKPPSTEPVNNR